MHTYMDTDIITYKCTFFDTKITVKFILDELLIH